MFFSGHYHGLDVAGLAHIGAVVRDFDAVFCGNGGPQLFNRGGFAQPVHHHVAALGSEGAREGFADAAGGAGDERGFSVE